MRKLEDIEIVMGSILLMVAFSFIFVIVYEMVGSSERKMAINAGLQQCAEGNLILWKKECRCKE